MAKGNITFSTEIDNSGVQKDFEAAKRKIDKASKSLENAKVAKSPLTEEAKRLGAELDAAKLKLAELQQQKIGADQALEGEDPSAFIEAYAQKDTLDVALSEQAKKVEDLQKKWDSVNTKIDSYDRKIEQANNAISEQKAKAGELSAQLASAASAPEAMRGAMAETAIQSDKLALATSKAAKSAEAFKKRMSRIVKSVFLFSLVTKALTSVVKYTASALKSNKEFTTELSKLKGALLTAFQPIYEVLVPALLALMRVATVVAQSVAQVFSLLTGKTASEYAENAKALYEQADATEAVGDAAKKAKRSLAGFDEINKVDSGTENHETPSPDFTQFSSNEFKKKIDELAIYVSGALLLIGMVLALSGFNIPLGIGLMAAGAVGLAAEAAVNWDTMRQIFEEKAGLITLISSILLVIGLILALSGFALPLGIGLIAVGAAGLATAAAVNWNSIVEALQGPIGVITAIASTAMLALGIILVCCGILPLGIALIAAGAAGLVTVAAVNWNAITDAIKNVINGAIKLFNNFLGWLNDVLHIQFDALVIGGVEIIPAADFNLASFGTIPYLAQGAVLPANKPFLAMVGDQKHGTNVEAPLATIQEAVAIVMEDMIQSNIAGHEATVGVLKEILEAVLGISIGDDVIGQAATRYNTKMAVIKGGL